MSRTIERLPPVPNSGPLLASEMTNKQAEFVRLLTRHSSQIYGFILMLSVNRGDAEDVFQDTSVVLWEKFDTYESGTNFRAWACRIAYFQVQNHRRAMGRLKTLSDEAFEALAADALALVEERDVRGEALNECLEKLRDVDRRLLEQKYFGQMTTAQLAEQRAQSTHSIYRALTRIHSQLWQCMQRSLASN
jgi:RNA polymerase sigma-70 factor, ECF subfamily